jgi:hypothetical protein
MNADHIGATLKGRRNGNGWLVRCPCPNHGKGRGDRFPSLSVSDGDDGRLLLRCFAGCEFVDILDELKHRGLVEGNSGDPSSEISQPVVTHGAETLRKACCLAANAGELPSRRNKKTAPPRLAHLLAKAR